MYVCLSRSGSEYFYLVGKPGALNRWAIKRLTASDARYYTQSTIAGLAVLAASIVLSAVALSWNVWAGVAVIIAAIVLAIFVLVFAGTDGEFLIGEAYDKLAQTWLDRDSLAARTVNLNLSLPLRTLVAQVRERTVDAEQADASTTRAWLAGHDEWSKQIDALLLNRWIVGAQKVLADNVNVTDEATLTKVADVKRGIAAATWKLAQEILAKQDEDADAVREALNTFAQSVPSETEETVTQWQQPSAEDGLTDDKDLR